MSVNLIAKATTTINAPASKVWEALITPELIKQYLFGTEAISEWKVGSPIEFRGEWEGKTYVDKGTILQMLPEKLFQHTYFSSFSKLEDTPENYANVTYELDEDSAVTTLTVRQENVQDIKAKEHSEKNWATVLDSLKKILEGETVNTKDDTIAK